MYTYIPTPTQVPMYIPVTSVYAQPSTGPTWLILLLVGIFYTILITFWVSLLIEILRGEGDSVNIPIFILFTIICIIFALIPFA